MTSSGFHTLPSRSLSAAQLGKSGVDVRMAVGGLVLWGAGGSRLDVPYASIRQMRVGRGDGGRYGPPLYRIMLWTDAVPRPLVLTSLHRDEAGLAGVARTAAVKLLRAGRPGALQVGLGWFAALVYPVGFLAFMAFVPWLIAIDNHKATRNPITLDDCLMVAAFALPIAAVFAFFFTRPFRPRRISTMAELEQFLPDS